jgi:hypothetical protein
MQQVTWHFVPWSVSNRDSLQLILYFVYLAESVVPSFLFCYSLVLPFLLS